MVEKVVKQEMPYIGNGTFHIFCILSTSSPSHTKNSTHKSVINDQLNVDVL